MRYILCLLLIFFLCVPASANVIRPLAQKMGAGELATACSKAGGEYSPSPDGNGSGCETKNCDGQGGNCFVACDNQGNCLGSTPSRVKDLSGLYAVATTMAPPPPFGLSHVSRPKLIATCKSVSGAFFGGSKDQYFCANPHCDPGIGPCYVECDLVKCTAAMPKKPAGSMSLLAILQNGDNVNHIVTPPEPNGTTDKGGEPATPTKGNPPPSPPVIY